MNNIVFVVPQMSQPRCIKRIASIQATGIPIKVYGFDRGVYSENLKGLPFKIEKLFVNPGKNKFSRLYFILQTLYNIYRLNNKDSLFYVFGSEFMNFMKPFLRKGSYIYEEADISAVKKNNKILRAFFLRIDKKCINNSKLTILTSKGFINYLFAGKKPNNVILLPNKLSNYFCNKQRPFNQKMIDRKHIRFGFIGLIRYPNTIVRFARIVGEKFPEHEFHFYGDQLVNNIIPERVKAFGNVVFHGPFKNPTDLDNIYSNVDINVVCYDTQSINVCIAEPNKLYESIYYSTPLVVSKGTFLEDRVNELNVGFSIDAQSDEAIIDFIKSLEKRDFEDIIFAMRNVATEELIDNPAELCETIKNYVEVH